MKYLITCLTALLFMSCENLHFPEGNGHHGGNDVSVEGEVSYESKNVNARISFSNRDKALIKDHYAKKSSHKGQGKGKSKKTPPGLAKKQQLPPGLQKQVQKNGQLPPGLQGRGLDYELERKLTKLPKDYVRLEVGTDIVLMNKKTRVVLDVIVGLLK